MSINRGVRFFDSLFPEEVVTEAEERVQGRDGELLRLRNVRLAHRRYWYQREFPKWRLQAIMDELVAEFEISKTTIAKVLAETEYEVLIRQLMNEGPSNKELRKRYKWMEWDKDKLI